MVVPQKRNGKRGVVMTEQNALMDIRTDKFYCWMMGFKADAHLLPLIHPKTLLQIQYLQGFDSLSTTDI